MSQNSSSSSSSSWKASSGQLACDSNCAQYSDGSGSALPLKQQARLRCQEIVHRLAAALAQALARPQTIDAAADGQATALLAAQLPPAALQRSAAAAAQALSGDACVRCVSHSCARASDTVEAGWCIQVLIELMHT